MNSIKQFLTKNALYLALTQAIVATLGSLYFSDILHFPPCVLCWWQRIAMYPLVLLIGAGILKRDAKIYQYVLPPALIGWCIAFFHNLLYYKIIPDTLAPCTTGVSCTTKFIEYYGFITIPFLSFVAFTVIIIFMLIQRNAVKKGLVA